jgi:tetratricopeptide (TPR) repeat protein
MPSSRKLASGLAVLGFAAGYCFAQREAPDLTLADQRSSQLWKTSWETDRAKKLAEYEQFAADFPKDAAIGWVYDQIYAILVDNNEPARTMSVSEKLLAIDPDDVELAYKSLKMAEGMKDPALVKKWSQKSGDAARRVIASPKDTETGHRRLALAPQVLAYLDYLAYTEILQTQNRAKKLELLDQFMQSSPKSVYIPAMQRLYLATWRESDPQKAILIAEKMIETDPNDEEALIMVAENYLQREKDPEKVMMYAEKVVALMDQTTKVEGVPDAEWSKRKAVLTGRANWLIGSVSMQQNKFSQADKSIRAALPYIKADPRLASAALFYLGWANYQIGNIPDAIRFTQDCTRVKGAFQDQAIKNLGIIRAEHPDHP